MAHIATVFVRVFPVAGSAWPRISQAEMLAVLMDYNHGNSYCVPLWANWVDGCVELQYGAKGSPGVAPAALWERRGEAGISAIWIRFHDDAGDHDQITQVTGPEHTYQWCRYGFDSIEAELGGAIETRRVTGSYRGGNPRAPAPGSAPAGAFEPDDAAAHEADLRARATAIRYFWRGRVVRIATRQRHGWGDAGLDGWDNCVDPAYVAWLGAARR